MAAPRRFWLSPFAAGIVALAVPGLAPLVPTSTPAVRAATAPAKPCVSDEAIGRARRWARGRPGLVAFAVLDHGNVRSFRGQTQFRSASLVKAMLLVADLRKHAASGSPLSGADRDRHSRMIRVSDNGAATQTFNLVGRSNVLRLARRVGMRHYRVGGNWGSSQLAANDQARFWRSLNGLLPPKYRGYGRNLLRTITSSQVWGGAPVARSRGYRTMFKSGWLPQPSGWFVHQGLRVERGRCTIGIAVLTGRQPSMATGVDSLRGVVDRLLSGA